MDGTSRRLPTTSGAEQNPDIWRIDAKTKTLGRKLINLVKTGVCTDVKFLLGQSRAEFSCHKVVLVSSSKVFAAMFTGDLAPSQNEAIEIPDVEPDAFISSIEFLYTEDFLVREDRLTDIIYVAVKYELNDLLSTCCDLIVKRLDDGNASSIYRLGKFYSLPKLHCNAYKFIRNNVDTVLFNPDFMNLRLEDIRTIISQSDFMGSEVMIFNAVMSWGDNQCRINNVEPSGKNLRKLLGDVIYLFRFTRFMPLYISRFVVPRNIYTDEEMLTINEFTSLHSTVMDWRRPLTTFSTKGRAVPIHVVKLFDSGDDQGQQPMNFTKKILRFSVDQDICMAYCNLHGVPVCSNATYKVNISFTTYRSEEGWIPYRQFSCVGVKGFGSLRLKFPNCVPIRRYAWYQMELEMQKPLKTVCGLRRNQVQANCGEIGDVRFFVDINQKNYVDQFEIGFKA